MTLRMRLVLLASVAVALAVLAASAAAWLLIRGTLMNDVDQRLLDRIPDLDQVAERVLLGGVGGTHRREGDAGRLALVGDPIGFQQVGSDGTVTAAIGPADLSLELLPEERDLLGDGSGEPVLRTVTVDGASYRVMSAAFASDRFMRMVQPLDGVEQTLTRMAWLLVGVAGLGVAAAGGLGWVIVRAGLRPVEKLTEAAERVATTKDLAYRIESAGRGRDEVGRLARSVNTMLAALDDARTEQRQLAENAGHELRTPLTTLRNDIGVLIRAERSADRVLDPVDRSDLLAELDSEATALTDLVAELVDLARGEAEPEPPAETDMRVLIDRAVERTGRVNPRASVEVRGAGFEAVVRPAALERAVANLVRNAVQVSDDSGLVEVRLAEHDSVACVVVLDNGPGIADHDMPLLFDRFYRGEGARERHGSGLGLAIVAQVVEQHGGSVEVANRPGGGAAFTLRVPVRPPSELEISESS